MNEGVYLIIILFLSILVVDVYYNNKKLKNIVKFDKNYDVTKNMGYILNYLDNEFPCLWYMIYLNKDEIHIFTDLDVEDLIRIFDICEEKDAKLYSENDRYIIKC